MPCPIRYEWAERDRGLVHGGIGMIARLVDAVGLAPEINASVELLKVHRPYHESDHVLNIAYNSLCGGQRLEDIETRRTDAVLLDGLGTASLPDPTTAGDFCRRFDETSIMALQAAINRARLKVWSKQPASFFAQTARIDADASLIKTDGQCKQGMDISYNGIWGYSALLVSLANTAEPLYTALHGANRPSHEGVVPLYDRSIELCREAGFTDILLRGDTDFSLTTEFDRWDADGVRFIFGYDAKANLIKAAENQDEDLYHELAAKADRELATRPRTRPTNVKDEIVRERGYKTIRPKTQEVVEFSYRPRACTKDYRVVAVRKNLSIERGEEVLFDEYRYFFFITNDWQLTADQVINEAHRRCNQRPQTPIFAHCSAPCACFRARLWSGASTHSGSTRGEGPAEPVAGLRRCRALPRVGAAGFAHTAGGAPRSSRCLPALRWRVRRREGGCRRLPARQAEILRRGAVLARIREALAT